ncbi:MAG: c-type cytochrome biogenesis protein CcsB [Desulfobacterales bacterium]|nr:c-type cytochrome biogenesis protein CcsB [Desulfobacterales bacterium]
MSTAGYAFYLFWQKEYLHKAGYFLLLTGFICHSVILVFSTTSTGLLPVQNLHEMLSMMAWALSGIFLIIQYKYQLKVLGIFAAPLASLVMVIAAFVPWVMLEDKSTLNNFWLIIHVIPVLLGDAAFALACGSGILYLMQERSIKSKSRGFVFKRLPSLEMLDATGYASLVIGFTLLTIGLISGLVYAKTAWGRFWTWDPKEVWSGITWLIYAVLLHERITVGWRGKRSAILAIIGFMVVLFTFFGVSLLFEGHHGAFLK